MLDASLVTPPARSLRDVCSEFVVEFGCFFALAVSAGHRFFNFALSTAFATFTHAVANVTALAAELIKGYTLSK